MAAAIYRKSTRVAHILLRRDVGEQVEWIETGNFDLDTTLGEVVAEVTVAYAELMRRTDAQ